MDWQPIETAPKDRDILVIFHEADVQLVVGWDEDATQPGWPWATLDGPNYAINAFSHWMPLPSPPSK